MDIRVPEDSLVVLCGVAGCGKSTFASYNFRATEIVSSDRCRALISDDEGNMKISKDAFELFHFIIGKRMRAGKLVVADSTALSYEARKKLLHIAHDNNYYVILIVFDVPLEKAIERNRTRERQVPEKVIENQYLALKKSLRNISKEGFDEVITLEDDKIKSTNCTIIPSNRSNSDKIPFKSISNIFGHNLPYKFQGIDFEQFIKPLYFKSREGYEIMLSKEEVEEAVKLLSLYCESLPWIVYIPPLMPGLSSGDIAAQVQYSLNYYADKGIHKCIVEERKDNEVYIVVISKDKGCSQKYFSGDSLGHIYSPNVRSQIEDQYRDKIISILYDDFKKSGYFEYHNTDFMIFEALINQDRGEDNIVPLKIIANSRGTFFDRDNLWQIENIRKLRDMSAIIKNNEVLVSASKNYKTMEIDRFINNGKYQSVAVKPVKVYEKYKDHFLLPEIMCTSDNSFCGGEYVKLSMTAYELGYQGMEMFVKNKFTKKYFEFLIGCVTINNRMSRMRMRM